MSGRPRLAACLVLLPLAACAGTDAPPLLAPLESIRTEGEPSDAAAAATAETAALHVMSGVITGELLVGGKTAAELLDSARAPAADPQAAKGVVAPRLDRQPALEARLVERWMSTRVAATPVTPADISRAQQLLAALGFTPGPADGLMGPRTRTAIEQFQAAKNLSVSGELSPSLLDVLTMEERQAGRAN